MSGRDPELRIELLGGFRVAAGATAAPESAWRLRKARAIVKLLALAPEHSLHRDRVIEVLWPERDPTAASNNLRQAVFVARRALDSCGASGSANLSLHADVLRLGANGVAVDVEAFESAAERAEQAPSLEHHSAAVALYHGELLPEDRFEPWAQSRREALRERYVALLVDVARLHQAAGDLAAATAALQQALREDPLAERAHRELMRLYAMNGRRQRALAQYHLLRESLRREFEDDPDAETRRLYQEILTRQVDIARAAEVSPVAQRRLGNLPLQLTSFVGREHALFEVAGLVRRFRLVTLTGPGGCGKTRLALETAAALRRELRDGVWLAELAGLGDAALVPHAVGTALGVESRSLRRSEDAIAAHVGEHQVLLVLDTCEHVLDACARLTGSLLLQCPNLRVLATSREPLHVAGEVNWRVPSLAPGEAAELFAERAMAVSSRFETSLETDPAVEDICRRLDGIPLAIELAAARVGVLAPAQIAERLRDSLSVLGTAGRPALSRQETLTATLDWSHDLLSPDDRVLYRRLGTFAGSFSIEAVGAVCGGDLDRLARLVDKSLVVVEEQEGEARYRLLDTIRHYARQRLVEAGEELSLERRHRHYYTGVAEALAPSLEAAAARRRLEREVDEVRLALRTALRAEPEMALRLAASLWRFWHDRGDRTEGRTWLEAALSASADPSPQRASALHGLSVLSLRTSDHGRALETANEAVALRRAQGDGRAIAEELHHLGTIAWVFSDYAGGERWCAQSLALARATDPDVGASVIHTLGVISATRSETAEARRLIEQSIEALRDLPRDTEPLLLPVAHGRGRIPGGHGVRTFLEQTFVTARRVRAAGAIAYALCDLAATLRDAQDVVRARARAEEALGVFQRLGDDLGAAQAMTLLGNLLSAAGEHEPARELHDDALSIREGARDARGIGLSLISRSVVAACSGDPDAAAASAQQALELFERTDDGPGRASAMMQLGYAAADAGQPRRARELQERALAAWRAFIPETPWCASILLELARLDVALGEAGRAPDRVRMAAAISAHNGDRVVLAHCDEALAAIENGALTPG